MKGKLLISQSVWEHPRDYTRHVTTRVARQIFDIYKTKVCGRYNSVTLKTGNCICNNNQNNIILPRNKCQQLYGDTTMLIGFFHCIKTLSWSMRLNNLVHDAFNFDIQIIFIPVFEGTNLHQMSETKKSMSMKGYPRKSLLRTSHSVHASHACYHFPMCLRSPDQVWLRLSELHELWGGPWTSCPAMALEPWQGSGNQLHRAVC